MTTTHTEMTPERLAAAAGLDVVPGLAELEAMAETIVHAAGGAPTPEVDLARAVPLITAEVGRLRAELAARPERAEVLTEAAGRVRELRDRHRVAGLRPESRGLTDAIHLLTALAAGEHD